MDPDELRKKLIELANIVLSMAGTEEDFGGNMEARAMDLAEAVHDMDEWLRKGGFLPDLWATDHAQPGRKQDV